VRIAIGAGVGAAILLVAAFSSRLLTVAIIEEDAGELSIRSAPGRYAGWIMAFVLILAVAWLCRRRRIGGNLAHGAFYASFAIPAIVVPGIALESVHVSRAELMVRTGLWFLPTVTRLPLTDIASITEESAAVRQRGLPRRDTHWRFRYRNGRERSLQLPDLLVAHRDATAGYLRRQGIPVGAE
jgi:hypothetical protein